jgi:hypothetical protein
MTCHIPESLWPGRRYGTLRIVYHERAPTRAGYVVWCHCLCLQRRCVQVLAVPPEALLLLPAPCCGAFAVRVPADMAIGTQWVRLTVVGHVRVHEQHPWWRTVCLCRCACGVLTLAHPGNLRTGFKRSCGCLMREENRHKAQRQWARQWAGAMAVRPLGDPRQRRKAA